MNQSQADVLLEHLLRGETITPMRAFELTGSMACHSRMAELRDRGHRIDCKIASGNGRRWGCYTLVREVNYADQMQLFTNPTK